MNQLARYIIILAVVAAACFLAWFFSDILTYILVAAILSIMGRPLVNILESIHFRKWRIPRSLCAILTMVALMGAISGIFLFIIPLFAQLVQHLSALDFDQMAANLTAPLHEMNLFLHKYIPGVGDEITLQTLFTQFLSSMVKDFNITQSLSSLASVIIKLGIGIFVVCFTTFFFLKEKDMFNNIVLSLFPEKYEQNASRALQSTTHLLSRYFIGICIETLAITLFNTIGLTLICGFEFPLAIVLAFASGVLNVIPYIGPVVGGLIGVSFGVLGYYQTPESVGLFLFVLPIALVYIATHLIDVFIFQPYIYSNSVKAHPLEIFMVIMVAGSIGGVVGMLVAIPAYTVIRVFAGAFFNHFKVVQRLTNRTKTE